MLWPHASPWVIQCGPVYHCCDFVWASLQSPWHAGGDRWTAPDAEQTPGRGIPQRYPKQCVYLQNLQNLTCAHLWDVFLEYTGMRYYRGSTPHDVLPFFPTLTRDAIPRGDKMEGTEKCFWMELFSCAVAVWSKDMYVSCVWLSESVKQESKMYFRFWTSSHSK
jgi:hypothetical protein